MNIKLLIFSILLGFIACVFTLAYQPIWLIATMVFLGWTAVSVYSYIIISSVMDL